MIKANELRIGNLVYESSDGIGFDIFEITCINSFTKTVIDKSDTISQLDYLFGIPITEDWLLKFGFDRGIYWRKDWFEIQQSEDEFSLYIPDNYVGQEYGEPLKYVHQLMNLYFALTGTELELKNENPV
jgi:hypothetical protein